MDWQNVNDVVAHHQLLIEPTLEIPAARATSPGNAREPSLLWMHTGAARVQTATEQHRLTAGQGIWMPAGVPYEVDVEAGSLAVPIFPAAGSRSTVIDRPLRVDFPGSWSDWLIHQFARSLGYLRGAADDSGLLDLVANAHPADPAHDDRGPLPVPPLPTSPEALTVARTLLQDPSHGAGIGELAQSAGISVRTLQQQFRNETGLPFARWRTAARVAAAASYLNLGHDIGWAGRQVGFSTPAGFTKAFHAHAGVTPSEYKGQHRDGPTGTFPSPLEAQIDAHTHRAADGEAIAKPPPIPASRTWNRINDFHVLVWACRGTAQLVVGGRKHRLRRGDAAWLPAGVPNSITLPRGALLLPLGSRPGSSAALPADFLIQSLPPQAEARLLHTVVANYSFIRPEGHDPNDITRRFLELFSAPRLLTAVGGSGVSAVSRIIEEIRREPASRRTLVQWGAELGVDARTLGHDFSDATGQTYVQWRAQLRMTLARQYLEERMTVSQAARKLGYTDASALTRVFTRAHGMSPREYQRNGWQHTDEELILR
ncbi:helix-turn-helix domain-containing protein [Streptomyces sp. NPDC015350]|uniref:helix-turn-helix domain-containing protein n=1 Tax=Streptomyces sp. NPDC015350 TaxID=3364955 RepID=UPI0036FCE560